MAKASSSRTGTPSVQGAQVTTQVERERESVPARAGTAAEQDEQVEGYLFFIVFLC